jgi:hypothetical protein
VFFELIQKRGMLMLHLKEFEKIKELKRFSNGKLSKKQRNF